MSQDQQTYSRATTSALIGLITQLGMTLLLAILGIYAESKAMIAGTFYLIPGLWIWGLLWIVYKQHRLERQESLEAAQLANADARSAALFDEAGAQLAQARRRLENLYKWAMPIVSLITAIYLIGVGVLLLYLNNLALTQTNFAQVPIREGVNSSLIALLLVIGGLGGFLVARYVAGMTRVDAWQALRGGASTLIGNVFLAILPLLVVTALLFASNKSGFVFLALALPIVMIVLGVEMSLALVLGFYRPRKPGTFVRPAFDSRLLGWLTRPESIGKIFSETINYQFGFEVSKSWFMQLLGRAMLPLAMVCVLIVIGMTGVVIIEPHEQGVVTFNGRFVRIAEPGLSFKAPWPLGRIEKYDVSRVHSLRLGSRAHIPEKDSQGNKRDEVPILWTNQHVDEGATEQLLITAPPPGAGTSGKADSVQGEMIGSDIDIKYRIEDLRQYAGISNPQSGSTDPQALLKAIAQQKVTRYFATHDTEMLLSTGRAEAGAQLQKEIQIGLDANSLGIEVVFVSVSGIHPPQEVAEDYHKRINALQESQTTEAKALKEADTILAAVAGSRERAGRLGELVAEYYRIESELNSLSSTADAKAKERLAHDLQRQHTAIQLLMIESGGEVGQRLSQAQATRWSTSLGAQARSLRLEAELEAFKSAPRYYPVSRYLDVLTTALKDRPKTVIGPDPDAPKPEVVLDLPVGAVPGINAP